MSGPNRPSETPPDLPPEYAEAYRRGYQRAYQPGGPEAERHQEPAGPQEQEQSAEPEPTAEPEPAAEPEETTRLESFEAMFHEEPAEDEYEPVGPAHREPMPEERRRMLAPMVLAALALLVILGAYGLGRLFSSEVSETDTSTPEPDGVVLGEDGAAGEDQPTENPEKKYDGQVAAAAIGGAAASCQSDSSVDAAGQRVGYEPANIYDGDPTTAWRCDGSGVSQRVTIELPDEVTLGEVGLIPGYAKTDPVSGDDRYAENNRITKVRWLFGDGSAVTQKLDGSAGNRSMQTTRIPKTATDQVVIEILKSKSGPRNTVAISEVRIGEVAE